MSKRTLQQVRPDFDIVERDQSQPACTNHLPSNFIATTDVNTVQGEFGDRTVTQVARKSDAKNTLASVEGGLPDVDSETAAFIKSKIARLCRTRPFTPADSDDLNQELSLAWSMGCRSHDALRGSVHAFRKTVIERAAAKLMEKARAQKRNFPSTISLDQHSSHDGSRGRLDPHRDCRRECTWQFATYPAHLLELRLVVQSAIKNLPPLLADLCERLMSQSAAEISRDLGIPPTTIASRVTAIRRRFESKKLSKFL